MVSLAISCVIFGFSTATLDYVISGPDNVVSDAEEEEDWHSVEDLVIRIGVAARQSDELTARARRREEGAPMPRSPLSLVERMIRREPAARPTTEAAAVSLAGRGGAELAYHGVCCKATTQLLYRSAYDPYLHGPSDWSVVRRQTRLRSPHQTRMSFESGERKNELSLWLELEELVLEAAVEELCKLLAAGSPDAPTTADASVRDRGDEGDDPEVGGSGVGASRGSDGTNGEGQPNGVGHGHPTRLTNGELMNGVLTNGALTNGGITNGAGQPNGVEHGHPTRLTNGGLMNGVLTNGTHTNGDATNGAHTNGDAMNRDPTHGDVARLNRLLRLAQAREARGRETQDLGLTAGVHPWSRTPPEW